MQNIIAYIRHNPGMVIVVLVCLLLGYNTLSAVLRNYSLQERVDKLNDEITLLELENNKLKYNNEYYKTDSYLERRARESLNLHEAGEKVVVVPKRSSDSNTDATDQTKSLGFIEQSKNNLQDWINLLNGKARSHSLQQKK